VRGYTQINGHPTWTTEAGHGAETVLLLHGGLSNSDVLDAIGGPIAERHRVVAFDRRGHGRTADTDADFHDGDMVTETVGVLETVVGGRAHVVGWSDGGIIALLAAQRRPDLADRMVIVGANYHFNGIHEIGAGGEPSEVFQSLAAAYAERSPDGPEHFEAVAQKTFALFGSEPTMTVEDLAVIAAPTLVMSGDDDLPTLEHTVSLYEALPAGQLAVLPAASHAVVLEKPALVAGLILEFLAQELPPRTLMPLRRAQTPSTAPGRVAPQPQQQGSVVPSGVGEARRVVAPQRYKSGLKTTRPVPVAAAASAKRLPSRLRESPLGWRPGLAQRTGIDLVEGRLSASVARSSARRSRPVAGRESRPGPTDLFHPNAQPKPKRLEAFVHRHRSDHHLSPGGPQVIQAFRQGCSAASLATATSLHGGQGAVP
jgi:pimeloyl-ACP methyl ester carboxylesterase